MNAKGVTPEPIMKLVTGHWSLKALAVAVDLSVFTALENQELTAQELSNALRLPHRSLERLLNANAALGFLLKTQAKYRNSEVAALYLVEKRRSYLGDFVKLAGVHGFAKWTRFKECVMSDAPIEDLDDDFRHSKERMQYFIRAMHNNAKGPARFLAKASELQERRHVLDLGGGSGAYSIALVERHPRLQATLVDFPPVCNVAREYVQMSRARDRIKIVEADLLTDDLMLEGDVILLSQVLHGMSEEQCKSLLRKCCKRTTRDGIIVVHEFLLDDDHASPTYPALFALNMLITTTDGNAYTHKEVSGWLMKAGYKELHRLEPEGPSSFLIGSKA